MSRAFGLLEVKTTLPRAVAGVSVLATVSCLVRVRKSQPPELFGVLMQVAAYGEAAHLPPGVLRALLPGPVTVVLQRRRDAPLSENLNADLVTIGARIPQDLIRNVPRKVLTCDSLISVSQDDMVRCEPMVQRDRDQCNSQKISAGAVPLYKPIDLNGGASTFKPRYNEHVR